MEQKIECFQITPMISPDGKRLIALSFGVRTDPAKHQTPNGMPILWDTRVQLIVAEDAWKESSKRFEVGKEYKLKFEGENAVVK